MIKKIYNLKEHECEETNNLKWWQILIIITIIILFILIIINASNKDIRNFNEAKGKCRDKLIKWYINYYTCFDEEGNLKYYSYEDNPCMK